MKNIPQEAIDSLPEGYKILGWGGEHAVRGFEGLVWVSEYSTWEHSDCLEGFYESCIYAVKEEEETESICEEAFRIQGGDRQQDYGSPAKNFQDIADMWNQYLSLDEDLEGWAISARDVAHMMILMKVCRNVHKPKRDNWVDIAGYAQCGGKVDGV